MMEFRKNTSVTQWRPSPLQCVLQLLILWSCLSVTSATVVGPPVGPAGSAGPVTPSSSNCAALTGSCVCIGDDVAQCVDTSASDLSFLRGLRNRSRFSEIIVYHNSIPILRNGTFQGLQLTNLKTIRLAYNGIITVEPRAFQGLRKLKKLVLVRNNIRYMHSSTFDNASKLSLVDLSNNQISEINAVRHVSNLEDCRLANNSISQLPQRAFCSTHSCRLRSINLANNEIYRVDSWAFHGLQNLETLNLSENKISSLHYLTFVNTTNLKELDLRRNLISTVDFVCEIQSLKYLFLSDNRISQISNDTFVCGHQSSLIHIDLSGNRIGTIEPAAFHGLYSVWDILLSRNRITSINPATFLNCTNLRSLDLRYNRISNLHFVRDIIMLWNLDLSYNDIETVPQGTFAHQNLTQLLGSGVNSNGTSIKFVLSRTITNINLSHNRLTSLDRGALEGLYKLYQLDLSWNNISYMAPSIFQRHSQMTRLNLRGNRLSNLDVVLSAPSVFTCDMSDNSITTLPSFFPHDTTRLRHLQLSSNNISFLPPNVFTNFTQLSYLNLTDNHLNSTNFVPSATALEYLYLSKNNLTTLHQHAFNTPFTTTIKSIDVSYNRISTVHDGAFESMYSLLSLNMSHNNIASLSPGTFRHTTWLKDLNLSNNRLVRMDFTNVLVSIKYLFLANNDITSVGTDAFAAAQALYAVDLSGNALSSVPEGAFRDLGHLLALDLSLNDIARVAPGAFRNASKLRVLRLARNHLSSVGFLGGAAVLEELDLSYNEIPSLPEPLVPGVVRPRLARLNLEHNRLSSLGPGAFRNLAALHALELEGNTLAQLHPAAFLQCSALLQLGLGGNRLARLADVPHVQRLKHLYVFANRMPRLGNDSFAASRLSQIVHLNVSNSGVQELEAGVFRSLRMLRYLDLSRNAILSLPDGLFSANTLLSALDLSHNHLLSVGSQLQPSVCLEFFDASANQLTAVSNGTFRDQIRYLDLSRNAISSVGMGSFDGLRKLEVLDLSGNNITSLVINRLRDGSVVLLTGNPVAGAASHSWSQSTPQEKRFFNLYDISTSELDKFAKLYMWILQLNNSTT